MKYPCPCCGYKTFDHPPDGRYTICQVCYWEDDPIQLGDPDSEGGANRVSLKQAQRNFHQFGACERDMLKYVRQPFPEEQRHANWKTYKQVLSEQAITIDLVNIKSTDELHQVFQDKLYFPDFYGGNWDAFWDSITSLVHMPDSLIITGLEQIRKVLPRDVAILEEIIHDYNELGISEIKFQ